MKSSHLTPSQRSLIRYHLRMTEEGIARKFGISVAEVREVRASAQPDHPARLAAIARRKNRLQAMNEFLAYDTTQAPDPLDNFLPGPTLEAGPVDAVRRRDIPAISVEPPLGQLHVEGGADLPIVLE